MYVHTCMCVNEHCVYVYMYVLKSERQGFHCILVESLILMFAAGQRENDFTVSGTVFLAVTGALLAVILILTFMIAAIVFASVKSRYYRENKNNNCKRHSIAGELALLYFFDIICMGLQCFTHVELNMCITIHAHTAVAPLFIMKPSQVCKSF